MVPEDGLRLTPGHLTTASARTARWPPRSFDTWVRRLPRTGESALNSRGRDPAVRVDGAPSVLT